MRASIRRHMILQPIFRHRHDPNSFYPGLHRSIFTRTITKTPVGVRLINFTKLTALIVGIFGSYAYLSDTRAGFHSWLAVPIIKAISEDDPEKAHHLAIKILKLIGRTGIIKDRMEDSEELSFELWGRKFSNPIGMAAGFDKDGDAIDGLFDIGFGYVEIGSITPEAQPGNPKPRMFRIPSTNSVINRYGFNSEGHFSVLSKLRHRLLNYLNDHRYLGHSYLLGKYDNLNPIQTAHADGGFTRVVVPKQSSDIPLDHELGKFAEEIDIPKSLRQGRILAVNLGKNKTSAPESIDDFKIGIERFGHLADVLVVNISSPNTPGLRNLQSKSLLEEVLQEVVQTRDGLKAQGISKLPAVLVKVAPDLSVEELIDVGTVAQSANIDGIIVSNTTTSRPSGCGTERAVQEMGGLSGPPLKPLSLRALSTIYSTTEGKIPLIGCGGISTGQDVLDYGKAGASFVQIYTALTYEGVGLPRKIKNELIELLGKQPQGKRWSEIIGLDAEKNVSIEELIEREKSRGVPPTSSYEEGVAEVKREIAYIEDRVRAYLEKNQQSPTLLEPTNSATSIVLEHPVPSSSQISSTGAPVSGFTKPTATINEKPSNSQNIEQVVSTPQSVEEPRGLFLEWQRRRKLEIESGEHRRVV